MTGRAGDLLYGTLCGIIGGLAGAVLMHDCRGAGAEETRLRVREAPCQIEEGFCVPPEQFTAMHVAWEGEDGYKDEIANLRLARTEQTRATQLAVRTASAAREEAALWRSSFTTCHTDLMRSLEARQPSVLDSPFIPGAVGCLLCGGMCIGLANAPGLRSLP